MIRKWTLYSTVSLQNKASKTWRWVNHFPLSRSTKAMLTSRHCWVRGHGASFTKSYFCWLDLNMLWISICWEDPNMLKGPQYVKGLPYIKRTLIFFEGLTLIWGTDYVTFQFSKYFFNGENLPSYTRTEGLDYKAAWGCKRRALHVKVIHLSK